MDTQALKNTTILSTQSSQAPILKAESSRLTLDSVDVHESTDDDPVFLFQIQSVRVLLATVVLMVLLSMIPFFMIDGFTIPEGKIHGNLDALEISRRTDKLNSYYLFHNELHNRKNAFTQTLPR